jgi:peptide/nickel transport system ATP-binding protein
MPELSDSARPAEYLLEVRNLKKYFPIKSGILKKITGYVKAVDDILLHQKGKHFGTCWRVGMR